MAEHHEKTSLNEPIRKLVRTYPKLTSAVMGLTFLFQQACASTIQPERRSSVKKPYAQKLAPEKRSSNDFVERSVQTFHWEKESINKNPVKTLDVFIFQHYFRDHPKPQEIKEFHEYTIHIYDLNADGFIDGIEVINKPEGKKAQIVSVEEVQTGNSSIMCILHDGYAIQFNTSHELTPANRAFESAQNLVLNGPRHETVRLNHLAFHIAEGDSGQLAGQISNILWLFDYRECQIQ